MNAFSLSRAMVARVRGAWYDSGDRSCSFGVLEFFENREMSGLMLGIIQQS